MTSQTSSRKRQRQRNRGTVDRPVKSGASFFLVLIFLFLGCGKKVVSIPGFTHVKKNPEGYDEYKHDKTGVVMVLLPGGSFWMGSTEEEGKRVVKRFMKDLGEKALGTTENRRAAKDGVAAERPRHQVTLRPFLIAKHELRQGIWRDVMGSTPSAVRPDGELAGLVDSWLREDDRWLYLPVEKVSWKDCQAFSGKTGLHLPTEAQWEYACRAGTGTPYAFGDAVSAKQANFLKVRGKTAIVNSYAPNAFGLHHMHGNVREWCQDVFSPTFYATPKSKGPDPLCASGSEFRVHRGGSWKRDAHFCRSAARSWSEAKTGNAEIGFRPVYNLTSD